MFEIDKLSIESSLHSITECTEEKDTNKSIKETKLLRNTHYSTPILTSSSFFDTNIITDVFSIPPSTVLPSLFSSNTSAPDQLEQLVIVLESLDSSSRLQLIEIDFQRGTTPLHYAAKHGLDCVIKILIKYFSKWGLLNRDWRDKNGQTPTEIAVRETRFSTVKTFLTEMPPETFSGSDGWKLLNAAVNTKSVVMLELLLDEKLDVNLTSELNESCLFIACKIQFIDGVKVLLKQGADVGIAEITNGWTPLFIACVTGNKKLVSMLLEADSDVCWLDNLGWTAMEHAGFRGFLKLAELTKPESVPRNTLTLNRPEISTENSDLPVDKFSFSYQTQYSSFASSATNFSYLNKKTIDNPKVSDKYESENNNKEYLCENSMVLISLGSMDIRDKQSPVELKVTDPTNFDLKISTPDCEGEYSFFLPIRSSLNYDPLLTHDSMDQVSFYTKSPENITIFFDVVTKHERKVVGRAMTILSDQIRKTSFDNMRSLYRAKTIPILNLASFKVLGQVIFEYLVINPFSHPKLGTINSLTYWDKLMSNKVIGHRGLGRNSNTIILQIGENTLESFEQAALFGATYVKFDVQLTKDLVPVIYHDYLVSETGLDIQTHSLTLEQFLEISNQRSSSTAQYRARSPPVRRYSRNNERDSVYENITNINHRIRNTRDWKVKKFKPNICGQHFQAPVITLEHAFKKVSKEIGFNIECKYPMIDECENEDMDCIGVEFNHWTDQLLKCVFDNANGRDVILSTFHPDVCIMLALKQNTFPVMFLTEAGNSPLVDVRANSLREAIKFAHRWNLVGIIPEAITLKHCPRLANVVKECGLKCITYGSQNDDIEVVKILVNNGVDAVISDTILPIKKILSTLECR